MSESLVGLAFGAGFGIVAFLISKTGGAQKAASLCGPIKNPKSGPVGVPLPADGKSAWICRCGQSKNFPLCDGSHNAYNQEHGTKFVPFEANRANQGGDTIWVCQCGQSKKRNEQGIPVCDGSHKNLEKK